MIIIGDLYVRSHGVAIVQEAIASSGGTEAHIDSLSYDVGDEGVLAEIVDAGLCSSITNSQPGTKSCVQSQEFIFEVLSGDVNSDCIDTFDDPFDDAMRCSGYDTTSQILDDDFKEVLGGSQDQCLY